MKSLAFVAPLFFITLIHAKDSEPKIISQAEYIQYAANGLYLSIWPGVSFSGFGESTNNDKDNSEAKLPLNVNVNISVKFGRKLGALRSEIEFSYTRVQKIILGTKEKVVEVDVPATQIPISTDAGTTNLTIGGDGAKFPIPIPIPAFVLQRASHVFTPAVNFYFDDIYTFGQATPFYGFGIGFLHKREKVPAPVNRTRLNKENNILLQVMTGIEYTFKKNFSTGAEFKIVFLPDASENLKNTIGDLTLKNFTMFFRLSWGVVYRIGD
ncbi:MAG: hypothetical protein HRT87_06860 [Legionellales bacterium]|nr:hypothetical protein [Legionellales bacterium]